MIYLTKAWVLEIALALIGDIQAAADDPFPPFVPYKRAQRHTLPCIRNLLIMIQTQIHVLIALYPFSFLVLRQFKPNGSKGAIQSWDQCVLRFHSRDINAMIYNEDSGLCTYGSVNEDQQEEPVFGRENGRESFFIRPILSNDLFSDLKSAR